MESDLLKKTIRNHIKEISNDYGELVDWHAFMSGIIGVVEKEILDQMSHVRFMARGDDENSKR